MTLKGELMSKLMDCNKYTYKYVRVFYWIIRMDHRLFKSQKFLKFPKINIKREDFN